MATNVVGTTKKKKNNIMKKPRKLADQSVEDFMATMGDSDSDDSSEEIPSSNKPVAASRKLKSPQNGKLVTPSPKQKKSGKKLKEKKSTVTSSQRLKNSLQDLKSSDPEFYKFLQKEDKDLLDDDDDDDDDDIYGDEDSLNTDDEQFSLEEPEKKEKEKKIAAAKKAFEKEILDQSSGSDDSDDNNEEPELFEPPTKLEVGSDDEDFEEGEDDSDDDGDEKTSKRKQTKLITASMVKTWTKQLQKAPSAEVVREVVAALTAAAQQAGIAADSSTPFCVDSSTVFNMVVRMCLTEMVPALEKLLTLKSLSDHQQLFSQKNKKWKSLKTAVKAYCVLMLQMSEELSEVSMINVVMRHIHKLVLCYAAFPKLAKVFMKKLVKWWGSREETTRLLVFLCLNKLVRLQPDTYLDAALKQMYMTYVNNCKFVSPSTLPLINFMQTSLVEMLQMHEDRVYQLAFLYIRQLAIHLRNAINTKKKDQCQAVYNWQYVLCLGLWSQLLSAARTSSPLQPLVYPLVQVIIGTVRLMPTARYYPLRFHCVRYLTTLAGGTGTCVPVIDILLEVLEQTDFNKKQKGSSIKNFSLSTILKFSKPQLQEKAFKEAVIEELCDLLFDYLYTQCHTLVFPEHVVPLVVQLKEFNKKCKVAALCRQVKEVVTKVEETAAVITKRRHKLALNLSDSKAVELWENKLKEEGTPLSKFYISWRALRDRQIQKDIASKDQIITAAEQLVPKPTSSKAPRTATAEERKLFPALFADNSDDDGVDDDDSSVHDDSDGGLYSDFDSDELEQLAKSASEGEDSSDDGDDDDDDDDEREKSLVGANNALGKGRGQKRKSESGKSLPKAKREKVTIENDGGDIVEDFDLSAFDLD